MIGTWVNVASIVVGGLIGLFIKRGIPDSINRAIVQMEGLAISLIGLFGVMEAMLRADSDGRITSTGGLLLLVSLVFGCLIGEFMRINDRLEQFGQYVESHFGTENFSKGFITASLIFCIGAMAIIGPLNDGLLGDRNILYLKSALDGTTALVLASALGIGVLFSAVPVLIVQGSIALLAQWLSPYLTPSLLDVFCMVGYALVICIGLNFLFETRIKTANLLPALIVPIVYHFLFFA